ncbi:MAG: DUF721 domain-containing protein [Alphaproteobacteria bacterium]|nr:DUF721 domain-containing protein [Alphaproteobacteria bacterium]
MKRTDGRRAIGPEQVSAMIGRVAGVALGKRGFAEGAVISEWPAIVGPLLAAQAMPLKLARGRGEKAEGVLHLKVASGAAAIELQHLEPLVLQRINGYFGYRAVARLALVQGPLPPRRAAKAAPPPPPPLAPADADALARRLDAVEDPDLRAALEGLGRMLAPRKA